MLGANTRSIVAHRRRSLALLMLLADVSGGLLSNPVSATQVAEFEEPILVDGLPPLMCGEVLCERPTRMIEQRATGPQKRTGQCGRLSYGPDLDWNGMDDRLQRVLAGQESISPTAIIGPDGLKTVAVVVDYPGSAQWRRGCSLQTALENHGWVGEDGGAWFQVMDLIDAVVVDKVPVSALMDLTEPSGVVVVEMQNVMVPSNGVASEGRPVHAVRCLLRQHLCPWPIPARRRRGHCRPGHRVDNEHRERSTTSMTWTTNRTATPRATATRKWVAGFGCHLGHQSRRHG